MTPKTISCTH